MKEERKIRVLLNVTSLSRGNPPAFSGNFFLSYCLAEALERSQLVDLHVATDTHTHPRFLEFLPLARCHLATTGAAKGGMVGIIKRDIGLKRLVDRLQPQVFHRPSGQLPFLPLTKCALVSTIADLNFKNNPQVTFAQRAYKEISFRWTFRRVKRVAAISEFTAGQITQYYGFPADRITVTHLGAVPRVGGACPTEIVEDGPYFLTFAQYSHKNCEAAIRAIHLLAEQGRGRKQLVVVGANEYVEQALKPLAAELGVSDIVRFPGYVPDSQLGALYENARGLLFLSRFEGFGMPVVEAFGANCPVIAARTSSLPEIVGDAGMLVDPDDVPAIAAAVERVDTDDNWRNHLIQSGRDREKLFSWDEVARKTLDVYQQAIQDYSRTVG